MIFPFRLKSKVFEERHIAPTRQRLRELGSLVCFLQDSLADDSLNLTALIDKFYFRLVVKAIRVTCLEKNLNQKCLQTCYSLDDCVDILIVTAIEKDDEDLEIRVEKFKTLWTKTVNNELTSKAKKQKGMVHAKKEPVIPSDSDVAKFLKGLNGDIQNVTEAFKKAPSKNLWCEMRNLTCGYIIGFNR